MRSLVVTSVSCLALVSLAAACSNTSGTEDETTRDSAGDVVDGGDLGVFALQLGDCVDASNFLDTVGPGDSTVIDGFAAIPCDEPHTAEVVLVDDEYFADLEEYTSEESMSESSTPVCIAALDEYTGTEYESSQFDFVSLVPTSESWDQLDDRGLVCMGITLNEDANAPLETSESMRA